LLELYTKEKNSSEHEFVDRNVANLKNDLIEYVEKKIDSTSKEWYRNVYIGYLIDIDYLSCNGSVSGIDNISQGLLSEVFFLNACNQIGMNCVPSSGDEDIIGIDFRLMDSKEARFFDISIRNKEKFMRKDIQEGNFPVLYIPWRNKEWGMSYAEAYIRFGKFNGRRFLERALLFNKKLECELSMDMKKKKCEGVLDLDISKLKYPGVDIQYIKNFQGAVELLENGLY